MNEEKFTLRENKAVDDLENIFFQSVSKELNPSLWRAAKSGDTRIVGMLLDKGAEVNSADEEGNTALHNAMMQGKKDATLLLIQKGADAKIRNKHDETPIMAARRHRDYLKHMDGLDIGSSQKTREDSLRIRQGILDTTLAVTDYFSKRIKPASHQERVQLSPKNSFELS